MGLRKSTRWAAASTLCAAVMLCGAENEQRSSNATEVVPSVILRGDYAAPGVEYARASNQAAPHEAVTQYLKGLAHFANGTWIVTSVGSPDIRGAWETIYSFRNDSAADASVTLRFFSPNGQLLPNPIKGAGTRASDYAFALPAGGARDVELDKTADPVWVDTLVSTGWAAFICDNADVKGQAFFSNYRYKLDGSVESKLTNMVPLTSLIPPGAIIPLPTSTPYSLPFYDNGMVSSYAFANTKADPVAMRAKFYDQQGVYLGSIDKTLPGFGQVSFDSTTELPLLDGKKGTMRVEGDGVIPLGFRFDTGTFTTLMP